MPPLARKKESLKNPFFIDDSSYELITKSIGKGIILVDNNDVIQYVNEPFCNLLGYSTNDLLGRVANEVLVSKENRNIVRGKIKERKKNISEEYEICLKTKNGNSVMININGFPIKDKKGKVIGSLGLPLLSMKRERLFVLMVLFQIFPRAKKLRDN